MYGDDVSHFMVDFETTGLDPRDNTIIEIGITHFKFEHLGCQFASFNIGVEALEHQWDAKTKDFHNRDDAGRAHLKQLQDKAIPADLAAKQAVDFIIRCEPSSDKNRYFWSKPSNFDYPFWTEFLRRANQSNPFHYRNIIDLNSFLRGRAMHIDPHLLYPRKHTALQDCHDQLAVLFKYIRGEVA